MEPAPVRVADDCHSSGLALAPCPATLSMGNLVVLPWDYQKAARASRRLIAPLPRLKFRVTVAVLSPAPPHLHPVKKAGVLGWEKVAHFCPGEAAMLSGQKQRIWGLP